MTKPGVRLFQHIDQGNGGTVQAIADWVRQIKFSGDKKIQGSAKRRSPDLVKFVAAVAYYFCLV